MYYFYIFVYKCKIQKKFQHIYQLKMFTYVNNSIVKFVCILNND